MKSLIALFCLLVFSFSSFADAGLGMSVQSNDYMVYFPVDVNDKFRVEPLVGYAVGETQSDVDMSTEFYKVALGVFMKRNMADDFLFLYGARFGYVKYKSSYSSDYSYYADVETEYDGYSVAPTIGLEHRVAAHFSVAGEFSLNYQTMGGSEKDYNYDGDYSKTETNTEALFKAMFYF